MSIPLDSIVSAFVAGPMLAESIHRPDQPWVDPFVGSLDPRAPEPRANVEVVAALLRENPVTAVVLRDAAHRIVALHGWNVGTASGSSAVEQLPSTPLDRSGKIDHHPLEHLVWSAPSETNAP